MLEAIPWTVLLFNEKLFQIVTSFSAWAFCFLSLSNENVKDSQVEKKTFQVLVFCNLSMTLHV